MSAALIGVSEGNEEADPKTAATPPPASIEIDAGIARQRLRRVQEIGLEIGEVENLIAEAEGEIDTAKGELKKLEAKREGLWREMRNAANGRSDTLFDQVTPAAAPDGTDLEAWRLVTLTELGIEGGLAKILEEHDPKLETLGALADWTSAGNGLNEIKGVGPAKADKLADAMEAYWAKHPRPAEATSADTRPVQPWPVSGSTTAGTGSLTVLPADTATNDPVAARTALIGVAWKTPPKTLEEVGVTAEDIRATYCPSILDQSKKMELPKVTPIVAANKYKYLAVGALPAPYNQPTEYLLVRIFEQKTWRAQYGKVDSFPQDNFFGLIVEVDGQKYQVGPAQTATFVVVP